MIQALLVLVSMTSNIQKSTDIFLTRNTAVDTEGNVEHTTTVGDAMSITTSGEITLKMFITQADHDE